MICLRARSSESARIFSLGRRVADNVENRAVLPGPKGEERIVAPYSSTGNTGRWSSISPRPLAYGMCVADTKVYWNLTRNIYVRPSPTSCGLKLTSPRIAVHVCAHGRRNERRCEFSLYFYAVFLADAPVSQHTVNEKASIDAHLQIVKFVHALVQAANDYDGKE